MRRKAHRRLTSAHTARVSETGDVMECEWGGACGKPASYGVSVAGARYVAACWEHAIFQAVPLAAVETVELAPVDWAFDDDAPA